MTILGKSCWPYQAKHSSHGVAWYKKLEVPYVQFHSANVHHNADGTTVFSPSSLLLCLWWNTPCLLNTFPEAAKSMHNVVVTKECQWWPHCQIWWPLVVNCWKSYNFTPCIHCVSFLMLLMDMGLFNVVTLLKASFELGLLCWGITLYIASLSIDVL